MIVKPLASIVAISLTTVASAMPFIVACFPRCVPQNVEFQDGAIAGRVLDAGGHPITI